MCIKLCECILSCVRSVCTQLFVRYLTYYGRWGIASTFYVVTDLTYLHVPILSIVTKDLPIFPRFSPTIFHRDESSAPLTTREIILLLNFSPYFSRFHAFRYGSQNDVAQLSCLVSRLIVSFLSLLVSCMVTNASSVQGSVLFLLSSH